jgi:YNFM family putative membrane transporter
MVRRASIRAPEAGSFGEAPRAVKFGESPQERAPPGPAMRRQHCKVPSGRATTERWRPHDRPEPMTFDLRRFAVAITGFCTFLNLYAPQALLPELSREFGVGPAEISSMITAGTLAIALTAPFTGAIADVLGRKRLITAAMFAAAVPTVMVALSSDVHSMVIWRFIQGLMLPPIFTVALAYVGDEWPPAQVAGVAGIYVAGSSIGGFCGRLIPGVLSEVIGWREAFLVLAGISLVGAIVVVVVLPPERRFRRSEGFLASGLQMLRHLANPRLLAIYAVGFGVLFNFIAVFTYVSFHLAAPPYDFTPAKLGLVFVTYLAGAACAPLTGWAVTRFGRRRLILIVMTIWAAGLALLLAAPVFLIVLGLVLCATCGMICQAVSTGYVTSTAHDGRSSAVGLYVSSFYVGGSVGGFVPGLAFGYAGWPGVVALTGAVLAAIATVVATVWPRHEVAAAPQKTTQDR